MKFYRTLTLAALCVSAPAAGAAQEKGSGSPLVAALAACQRQTEDAARLRCYDQAAGALTRAADTGDLVVVNREDVRKTRRSLFGFSVPRLPFFTGDKSAADQQDEITAKLATAGGIGYGKFRMKLEDGALWETTEGFSTMAPPRSGDTVVIKRGPLGSYMIRIAGQRGVRAKRVG